MQVLLVVVYMVLAHLSLALADARLAVVAMGLLLAMFLVKPLRERRVWAYLLATGAAVTLTLVARSNWVQIALFFPPTLINLGLAWLFGHTLLAGRTPLVARIVRLLHADDDIEDPAVWVYARSVTVAWTALFLFNAAICLMLALIAAPKGLLIAAGYVPAVTVPTLYWTLYSDVVCYALVALMFCCEYLYRQYRFPRQPYRNLFDFLRRAAGIGPALAAELWPRNEPARKP